MTNIIAQYLTVSNVLLFSVVSYIIFYFSRIEYRRRVIASLGHRAPKIKSWLYGKTQLLHGTLS